MFIQNIYYKIKIMMSDRIFFISMILLPLIITIISANAFKYEKLDYVPVSIIDEDKSDYSKRLIEEVKKDEYIKLFQAKTVEVAENMLKNNDVEVVYIIKEGFGEKFNSNEAKESIDIIKSANSYTADFVSEVISSEYIKMLSEKIALDWVVKRYTENNLLITENLKEDVSDFYDSMWYPKPLMEVKYKELHGDEEVVIDSKKMIPKTPAAVGIILIFIMFYILSGSEWLIEEKNNGTLKRLVSISGALKKMYISNIIVLILASLIQLILFSVVCNFLFNIQFLDNFQSYFILLLYIVLVTAICMFFSAIFRNTSRLQIVAPIFTFGTGFLGGCFWTNINLEGKFKNLSYLAPQGFILDILTKINSNEYDNMVINVSGILLISFVMYVVSYKLIKIRI